MTMCTHIKNEDLLRAQNITIKIEMVEQKVRASEW